MKNRNVVVLYSLIIVLMIFGFALIFGWLDSGNKAPENRGPDQKVACTNEKTFAMTYLRKAIEENSKGEDSSFERGEAHGRLWTIFQLCFVPDPDHPDAAPAQLLNVLLDDRTPTARLVDLQRSIEDGWAKSKVGEPWKGDTK